MSRNFFSQGRRRDFIPTVAQKAGDLSWAEGFFGTLQDDAVIASGSDVARPAVLLLEGVWDFKAGTTLDTTVALPAGKTIFALGTYGATTLKTYPAGSVPSGGQPVGRLFATYAAGASYLRVQLQPDGPGLIQVSPTVVNFQ